MHALHTNQTNSPQTQERKANQPKPATSRLPPSRGSTATVNGLPNYCIQRKLVGCSVVSVARYTFDSFPRFYHRNIKSKTTLRISGGYRQKKVSSRGKTGAGGAEQNRGQGGWFGRIHPDGPIYFVLFVRVVLFAKKFEGKDLAMIIN